MVPAPLAVTCGIVNVLTCCGTAVPSPLVWKLRRCRAGAAALTGAAITLTASTRRRETTRVAVNAWNAFGPWNRCMVTLLVRQRAAQHHTTAMECPTRARTAAEASFAWTILATAGRAVVARLARTPVPCSFALPKADYPDPTVQPRA